MTTVSLLTASDNSIYEKILLRNSLSNITWCLSIKMLLHLKLKLVYFITLQQCVLILSFYGFFSQMDNFYTNFGNVQIEPKLYAPQ